MKHRVKAFSFHLLISMLVTAAVIALVFLLWYPAPLHTATGVTHIFLILLGVDMILGPALTLLVYKPGKKTLVMDLTVIALLQLAALSYGIFTVAEGRPVWIVYAKDRFDLVRFNEIDDRRIDQAATQFRTPSWSGPQWAAAVSPQDSGAKKERLMETLLSGVDISQMPDLFQPLSSQVPEIKAHLSALDTLTDFNSPDAINTVVAQYPQADAWLPLRAGYQDMVVLLQKKDAGIVAVVDLRPW